MVAFLLNSFFWIFAIYGIIEFMKEIYYICTCTKLKANGIYIIIAAKDEENKIEYFIRTFLFKIIYGKEEYIRNVIFTDLDSKDNTGRIMENLQNEYKDVTFLKWKNCKELIDNINKN